MKSKKLKHKNNRYFDPNELKFKEDNISYLKGLAGIATIFGAGATGAILTNDRVYAAETSVDVQSQVVGSIEQGSQSTDNSSTDLNSQLNSNNADYLKSQKASQAIISNSAESSLSNSTTISTSQQTSKSNSLSDSTTTSTSGEKSTSDLISKSISSTSQRSSLSAALSQSEVTLNSSNLNLSLTKKATLSTVSSASLATSTLSTITALTSATGANFSLNLNNEDKKQDIFPVDKAMFTMLAANVSSDESVTLPSFTGAAWFDANGKTFESGSTIPSYKVRLSTSGTSTVQDPKFIIMIPGGFTANESSFDWSGYTGKYSVEDLGNYGPNKEQLFMVTLDGSNPAWNTPSMTVGLTLNAAGAGQYIYNNWGAPLVSEVSTDGNPAAGAAAGAGNYTFNINGQEIQVSKSTNTVNDTQWFNSASTVSYSVQAGNEQLNQNSYKITNLAATPHEVTNPNDVGYEQLEFTFNSTGEIKSGEYFDVKLGLPTSDGKLLNYDSTLAASFPISYNGSEIGTVYNMGTYYRVVFNSNVEQYTTGNNNFKLNFELRWGNDKNNIVNNAYMRPSVGTDQSSSDNLGKVFVYQYTNDKNLNKSKFAYTPTNDVQIGEQNYASGLHIQGQYIFDGKYQNGNTTTTGSLGRSTNRTWTPSNQVSINTNWFNSPQVQIATNGATNKAQNTSNDFNITISVGKNDYLNYYWATDEDLVKQFQDIIAPYVTNTLSNQVEDGASSNVVYVNSKVEEQDTPTTKITVTHTEETLSDGRIQRVYHVVIADPSIEFKEDSQVAPLTVSANNYTMPSGINSYQEDLDAAKSEGTFGTAPRNSASTSNTELAHALANTPIALISVTNNTTNQNIFSNLGSNWIAAIAYQTNGNVDGAVDPSNTRTATLKFIDITDPNHPILLPEATNTTQGEADSSISFSGATSTMSSLASQGYEIERVENNQTGTDISAPEGVTKNDLSKYNFGKLINSANEYTVYISKAGYLSTSQSTSQSIIDSISTVGSQSTSQSIVNSISTVGSQSISQSIVNSVSTVESQSISQSIIDSVSNSIHTSQSFSTSTSVQGSQSLSNSVSRRESLSNSVSMSESMSNSVSMSESMSNLVSMSESLSNSVSMSESMSNSVSMSESMSNSVSMSESLSNSVSMSESLSNSVSMSESLSNSVSMSESLSNSVSMSESLSNSVSMSDSLSNSVSMSESLSNSVSMSESLSNSVSMSESLSNSVSMSESLSNSVSMSESLSNSVSMSESLSNSVSMSDSLSNSVSMSESLSNSVSMSESLSNSVSMSESLSNSVSMSESLSNSVSMSESLSNSVSMSESLSNSVSMSESLSNSVSMSESLSNSVSMSESLSNSVSMSESLSNSVSMSESLSNSVSMSESLSNSVSMSESLSNSVSMSESLSNSVSMSESLSNSVSMSESLSNSVSMSESLSNSVSMSESLSNSVSMSESLSNSVSMSESLSNSVSMSESLSNSVSMSESLSNSVSMSESLSNSVSMSESLSNSVSMSESLSNSVSMSESLSNSVSMSESLSNSVSMSESQSSSTSTTTSTNSTNNNGSKSTPTNSGTKSTSTDTLKPQHKNAESVDKSAKKDRRRGKLPQTGAESNSNVLGLMIAALGGLLGSRRKKRKDEDKD